MQPIGPAPVMSTSSPTRSKDKRGVHGVAERIETGKHIERNRWDRQCQTFGVGMETIFGEGARTIHADALCVRAKMTPAGQTISAMPANDVAFAVTRSPGCKTADCDPDLIDYADEFVADDHRHRNRFLRPRIPVVNVNIGAADRSLVNRGSERRRWPTSGTGTSSSQRPGSARLFTSACIVLLTAIENRQPRERRNRLLHGQIMMRGASGIRACI